MTMPINIRSRRPRPTVAGNQFAPGPLRRAGRHRRSAGPHERRCASSWPPSAASPAWPCPTPWPGSSTGCRPRPAPACSARCSRASTSSPATCRARRSRSTWPAPASSARSPSGPMTGSAANITLLSYVDELNIGVNTDPRAVDQAGPVHGLPARSLRRDRQTGLSRRAAEPAGQDGRGSRRRGRTGRWSPPSMTSSWPSATVAAR